jgi:hypothetical protein
VRDGTPPATAPRIKTTGTNPPSIVRDEHGNALGGLRTPLVDAPLATITGNSNSGSLFCSLFGTTAALDASTVATLYPTHDDYVRSFSDATKRAVRQGYLLRPEAKHFLDAARALDVPTTTG